MKLRMLFDEKRRGEIRDAIKAGKPIEFRGKLPAADVRRDWEKDRDVLIAGMDERAREEFYNALGKRPEEASISDIIGFAYGGKGAGKKPGDRIAGTGRINWWSADIGGEGAK